MPPSTSGVSAEFFGKNGPDETASPSLALTCPRPASALPGRYWDPLCPGLVPGRRAQEALRHGGRDERHRGTKNGRLRHRSCKGRTRERTLVHRLRAGIRTLRRTTVESLYAREYRSPDRQPCCALSRPMPVSESDSADVRRWLDSLSGTPDNANRTLPVPSLMGRQADPWDTRSQGSNPCRSMHRYTPPPHKRFLSLDMLKRLDLVLDPADDKLACQTNASTSQRVSRQGLHRPMGSDRADHNLESKNRSELRHTRENAGAERWRASNSTVSRGASSYCGGQSAEGCGDVVLR